MLFMFFRNEISKLMGYTGTIFVSKYKATKAKDYHCGQNYGNEDSLSFSRYGQNCQNGQYFAANKFKINMNPKKT